MNSEVAAQVPYWAANLPNHEVPTECPAFLRDVSERDRVLLSVPQEAYQPMSWKEIQDNVRAGNLAAFRRSPLDLRRYRQFVWHVEQDWGGMMEFILRERLQWDMEELQHLRDSRDTDGEIYAVEPDQISTNDFFETGNYKILPNDWPYGVAANIHHLVVWTKHTFTEDMSTGKLSTTAQNVIQRFVDEKFGKPLGDENVLWFHNWKALKSVHSVEHFHVMLHKASDELIASLTKNARPLRNIWYGGLPSDPAGASSTHPCTSGLQKPFKQHKRNVKDARDR